MNVDSYYQPQIDNKKNNKTIIKQYTSMKFYNKEFT